jgi:hypothetical protein
LLWNNKVATLEHPPRARGETGVVLCLFHPVGTDVTVIFKDKASFGRVLYEGTKVVRVSFMIATALRTDRKRFRLRLDSTTTKSQRLNLEFRSNLSPGKRTPEWLKSTIRATRNLIRGCSNAVTW